VRLPLWPSSLFAPSTHAAHTTTAAISRFIFLNGWDLA
jgi:4'-phosphopantetheinyl transferase EntD